MKTFPPQKFENLILRLQHSGASTIYELPEHILHFCMSILLNASISKLIHFSGLSLQAADPLKIFFSNTKNFDMDVSIGKNIFRTLKRRWKN